LIRKEEPRLILAMRRSGIIRKRTVRSSGGSKNTEGIDGGLIARMRSQSGTIIISTELLT